MTKQEILNYFPRDIKNLFEKLEDALWTEIFEIRVRSEKPVMVEKSDGHWFMTGMGVLSRREASGFIASTEEMARFFLSLSENSIYAFQQEIQNGYITIKGGHRVGFTGRVVMQDQSIKTMRDISGINIRVAHQVFGCANKILPYIVGTDGLLMNTLIVSPPRCGKTTVLRDIARLASSGCKEFGLKGEKIGIVDERSEIAACFKGVPQNDVGLQTDVIDCCPKRLGMELLLRSMSPDVIVIDEIGNQGDKDAVLGIINAGVNVVATAHGYGIIDLRSKREVFEIIKENVFDRIIVLSGIEGSGTLEEVVDNKNAKTLYCRRERA